MSFHLWMYIYTNMLYTSHSIVSPPAPSPPYAISVASTSITLGWDVYVCDGGHRVASFTIQYTTGTSFYSFTTETIWNIHRSLRNYTITGLQPDTEYRFRIQAVSFDLSTGFYSRPILIRTLPPGTHVH